MIVSFGSSLHFQTLVVVKVVVDEAGCSIDVFELLTSEVLATLVKTLPGTSTLTVQCSMAGVVAPLQHQTIVGCTVVVMLPALSQSCTEQLERESTS